MTFFYNDVIINTNKSIGVKYVHYVGKINKNIYQEVIKAKIITDEVIITDNRIQHIIDRRGQEFYDEYNQYFSEIISNPDYIFKDNALNTVIVTKSFKQNNTNVNLIVKLVIEGDDNGYKNSIITAIKENNKRFEQRLRNNNPSYINIDKSE